MQRFMIMWIVNSASSMRMKRSMGWDDLSFLPFRDEYRNI